MRPRYLKPSVVISHNRGGTYVLCELDDSMLHSPIVRATSGGYGSVTQLAEGDPKCIRVCTDNIIITTHLAEEYPKRTSLGIPYARLDASEASEA